MSHQNKMCCFHLSIPVFDLQVTKDFYHNKLGLPLGRSNNNTFIIDFYGHQIVAHRVEELPPFPKSIYPHHFGLNFYEKEHWSSLLKKVKEQNIMLFRPPGCRFAGRLTEHDSFFIVDPSHNLLEFKYYKHQEAIFGATQFSEIGDA